MDLYETWLDLHSILTKIGKYYDKNIPQFLSHHHTLKAQHIITFLSTFHQIHTD